MTTRQRMVREDHCCCASKKWKTLLRLAPARYGWRADDWWAFRARSEGQTQTKL